MVRSPSGAWLLAHLERLDDVVDLDVVERPEADTALEALADLGGVVLEPPQRLDREVVGDHHAIAHQAGPGVAPDEPVDDHAARDVAELRRPEHLADLRRAERDLLELGLEHALEGGLDLVDRLVDDRVVADVDALALGKLLGALRGAHVERDDDALVDGGEVDVVVGDRTDAAVDDPQRDLLPHVDLEQGVLESLDGAGDVALDDEVERLDLALLQPVLQRDPLAGLGEGRIAGAGDTGQTEDEHRTGRSGLLQRLAELVEHRPHAPVGLTGDDRVARAQRAALDEDGRNRSAALVEVALDGNATRRHVWVGTQVERRVGGQDDG